jgi:hypothetical protein
MLIVLQSTQNDIPWFQSTFSTIWSVSCLLLIRGYLHQLDYDPTILTTVCCDQFFVLGRTYSRYIFNLVYIQRYLFELLVS